MDESLRKRGYGATAADVFLECEKYIHSPADLEQIKKAYAFADKVHAGKFRKSGEPYVYHLIEVAYILATLQTGPETVAAGFLHDTIEDCGVTIEQLSKEFSPQIASLVDSVTKVTRLGAMTKEEFYAENHRKIFIAMAKDIRVIIIKLADRLHNMRTLYAQPEEAQKRISKETLEVYAPIAHRLGINTIKSELEDLSLKYLEPEKYHNISALLHKKEAERNELVKSMSIKIETLLKEHNIPYRMAGRVKNIYSIYKKIYVKKRKFEEIYDLQALRVITDTETHCYEVLGYIHAIYRPIPGRFKDYIAMPKPNMYQSLHTTILSEDGGVFEIQIRTEQMDQIAESGVAAHWRYKENIAYDPAKVQKEIEEKLAWFRELVTYSADVEEDDAQAYVESLQHDIFDANVYILTPKGRVIDLPNGSTPVDFAYKIHTQVGNATIGAIVNGVIVPLDTELKTGDIVDIKTTKTNPAPSEDWLKFVKTSGARNAIRKALIKHNSDTNREQVIDDERQKLEETIKEAGLDLKTIYKKIDNPEFLKSYNVDTLDNFLFACYSRSINTRNVIDSFKQEKLKLEKQAKAEEEILSHSKKRQSKRFKSIGIILPGADNIAVSFSQCCSPIPGDDIVGYISKGQGVKIHRADCPNIKNEAQRLIDVEWDYDFLKENKALHYADIQITAKDRPNLLVDAMNLLSQMKIQITSVSALKRGESTSAQIQLCILVADSTQLQDVMNSIKTNVKDVYEVNRYTKN
ncbi:MAG: bifunctional (p)ppGpp synthetase/guanosine-3',5'-bis(diphosphate) 3'-pyrophosphohydrolase [Bacilli bacterium]|nr:bifunctional (p)ppGpp synthetase/guanosine-3',5'-bis(diphosphate) 3'-pyrophosphohydrolase [Bacilli bacterium]MDD3421997.1 bifunctional (p)ppGpp synthetase/guanosine-3',5'-bis(diphosphate) 3'-pyrophosphohydrolase [Bacilli bacterium]MDD4066047.1 bifunctional (p)ppGpp synthetase/guanosine-3',5'-bis(diphosphate) 3'-pyrophosphohydrolase [Bacilli bacterium]